MTWWADLSKRERLLVAVAAALFLVLFVSLFVMRPIAQWREDAADRAASARDGYELVASAAAVGAAAPASGQASATPLRQAVLSSAAAAGIELVRISNAEDGQVEVQSQPVDGARLYAWLETLEKRYGASVVFADIARGEAGAVNAQVLVLERR